MNNGSYLVVWLVWFRLVYGV